MTSQAYGQAYQKGFDRTVRFLISRGAFGDRAVEAAQAAWVRGWERLYQLRDENMLLTWVNTIALNAYRAGLRKEKMAIPLSERHCESEIDLTPIDLETVLKACSQRERALLELQIQGTTTGELAGLRGVSPTAIRIRLLRARRAVRKRVENARIQRFRKACPNPHARVA
jgi:DNA-directed RNA polymerase specialized sigma24 family protein